PAGTCCGRCAGPKPRPGGCARRGPPRWRRSRPWTARPPLPPRRPHRDGTRRGLDSLLTPGRRPMTKFLLWCLLFVVCWPVALLALLLYPLVWLLSIPFRLVGIAVEGALGLVRGIILLPARVLGTR